MTDTSKEVKSISALQCGMLFGLARDHPHFTQYVAIIQVGNVMPLAQPSPIHSENTAFFSNGIGWRGPNSIVDPSAEPCRETPVFS